MYKRILLKLSGEALSNQDATLDVKVLTDLLEEIKTIRDAGTKIGIVVGGGNVVRGKSFEKLGFERTQADKMGMLGTVINALALETQFNQNGLKAKAYAAFAIPGVIDIYDHQKAIKEYEEGTVLIFAAGVGQPYFSTDTACAFRASQINAEVVLIAKNGVDGVYSADPDEDPNAVNFDAISSAEIVDKRLGVIDLTASCLLMERKIESYIFNMNQKGNILKAVNGEKIGTRVTY